MKTSFFIFINLNVQSKEKEKLGFFPDVPEVECECAINARLEGPERQMTWSKSPGMIFLSYNMIHVRSLPQI